jgi:hypothetical protein
VEVRLHAFVSFPVAGDEWSALPSGCFTAGQKSPDAQRRGGLEGCRGGPDVVKYLTNFKNTKGILKYLKF